MDKWIKFHKEQTLYLPVGIPGSGKSTLARRLADQYRDLVVICPDDLRTMIKAGDYGFSPQNYESCIFKSVDALVEIWLKAGFSVYVDETNLNRLHRRSWLKIAQEHGVSSVVMIAFEPNVESHWANRLKADRGLSAEEWREVCERMAKQIELPVLGEFDSFNFKRVEIVAPPFLDIEEEFKGAN